MRERLVVAARNFFLAPSRGEVLSALRIVVGSMMFLKGLFLLPHIDSLYGQFGYLQAPLMEAVGGGNIASWAVDAGISQRTYSLYLHLFFGVHLLSAVSFALGYRTRLSNIVLWGSQTILFHLAWVSAYGIDSYSQNLCFFMLWLPVGRFWSLDAKRGKLTDTDPTWLCTLGLRCIQFYVLLTYVDAGVSKAAGIDWWTGGAIWQVLHLPEFNTFNFFWLAEHPWIPKAIGLGTVGLEALYIVGVWIPKVGKWWAASIILMHLVIASLVGLVLFGVTLALVNMVLFLFPRELRKARLAGRWVGAPAPEWGLAK